MVISRMKKVWILAICMVFTASFCLYFSELKLQDSIKGDLIFTKLNGNIAPVYKIKVEHDGRVITLHNEQNLWRVEEADNYYADFNRIHNILNNISTAKIGNEITFGNLKDLQWYTISLFDKQNKNLGTAVISESSDTNIRYIKLPNKTCFTTWHALLPKQIVSWTRQPLISFDGTGIREFIANDKGIYRNYEGDVFYNKENHQRHHSVDYIRVFNTLHDLYYDKVLSSQEFDENKYTNFRIHKLINFNGLITELQYATDYKEYWVKITLSSTSLPSNTVIDYIKDNNIFYQDWWFRLPTDEGRSLFMFNL